MPGSSKLGALGVVVFLAASLVAGGNARPGAGGVAACGVASGGENSGETCNVIAAGGPCVAVTFSTAAAPTPAGGAFAAGTYNLTSETLYGSAELQADFLPGQPFRRTYVLSDVTSTSFTLDLVETLGTIVARAHETVAVSGMTATFTPTCPPADAGAVWGGSDEFTVTSTSITLIRPVTGVSGLIDVRVYDKAP